VFDRISEANRSDIEVAETSATQGPGGGAETWMLWEMNKHKMMRNMPCFISMYVPFDIVIYS
jgi:hypothetical protein